ncbi:MAG TPA: MFS transporter [Flexivirga sp.]|uniref:MFS transporter n=1 Tax=Flexivirga sp. TaxID=1962927 RepID=UPI002C55FE82|nr:MFS transporter [Flexivirga sp.]HWC21856.1 MFS transporter [Flexivirga sp.]
MTAAAGPAETLPLPFRRLWLGETVSSFGTYVTLIGLQFLVLRTLHGGPQDVGWLNSARWLPYLVLGLFAGVIVDRCRRRPMMVGTDLACGLLVAAIPAAWALDVLSIPVLITIVLLYGAAALFNDAASMAYLPALVPRHQLQRSHARLDGSSAVAQTAGPTLAGGLIKLFGAPWAILVDALSYLFSAAMMAGLPARESGRAAAARSSVRRDIREGVRWVYRPGAQRWLAIGTHLWFAANSLLGVAIPTFALHTLDLSALQFGVATALAGVGAIVGAAISTRVGNRLGTGGAVIAAHGISAVGVGVMALAGPGRGSWVATAVLAAGQCGHGLAMGMSNSHEMSYRQATTADHLQARVNITMRAANRTVIVVVAPLAGVCVAAIGTRMAVVVAAVAFVAVTVVLLASPFRSERIVSR